MTCNAEQILAYIDGDLSPEDAARVRAHTAVCDACRHLLHSEQALDCALGGLSDFAPPPQFATDTVRRAECDVRHALHSPRERKRAAAVAGGLGSLSLVLLWPTGILSTLLSNLAPLRCLGRFALGWVENSAHSFFIVSRAVSRGALQAAHIPVGAVAVVLVLLVSVLAWMLVAYRRQSAAPARSTVR